MATEAGFRALLEMSALHHVRPGTGYPTVLLTTGLNDPRVEPWQPGKIAAALQAATSSGRPVLLRVEEGGGHSIMGATQRQARELLADIYAFLASGPGMPPYRPAAAGTR